jgi:hypothetical protein
MRVHRGAFDHADCGGYGATMPRTGSRLPGDGLRPLRSRDTRDRRRGPSPIGGRRMGCKLHVRRHGRVAVACNAANGTAFEVCRVQLVRAQRLPAVAVPQPRLFPHSASGLDVGVEHHQTVRLPMNSVATIGPRGVQARRGCRSVGRRVDSCRPPCGTGAVLALARAGSSPLRHRSSRGSAVGARLASAAAMRISTIRSSRLRSFVADRDVEVGRNTAPTRFAEG